MKPFNRIGWPTRTVKPEPNPRPFSDAEIVRARLAGWLRKAHKDGVTLPEIIARIHDEPSDSDWCPGYGDDEPKQRDRS